jgi:hypothetical protein
MARTLPLLLPRVQRFAEAEVPGTFTSGVGRAIEVT